MRRLIGLMTVKVQPIGSLPQNRRHKSSITSLLPTNPHWLLGQDQEYESYRQSRKDPKCNYSDNELHYESHWVELGMTFQPLFKCDKSSCGPPDPVGYTCFGAIKLHCS